MNAEDNIEINADNITFEEVFDSYYTMIKKEKSSLDIASAVAFVGAASVGGAFTAIMASTTALQMRKKKTKITEKYDEEAVNNTLSASNISLNSNKDVEMKNTDIVGNIESSGVLNNVTVEGRHEYNETVFRSGGKWWKAGMAGLAIGLTSRFILNFGVNFADNASVSMFGDGTSNFTKSVINMANSVASIWGKTYNAVTRLGLITELFGSTIIESTIISPTLGKYND